MVPKAWAAPQPDRGQDPEGVPVPEERDVALLEARPDRVDELLGPGGDLLERLTGVSPGTTPSTKTSHGRPSRAEMSAVVMPS